MCILFLICETFINCSFCIYFKYEGAKSKPLDIFFFLNMALFCFQIGSASRQSLSSQMGAPSLTNHLSSGPLVGHQMVSSSLSNSMSVSSPSSAAVDALVSSLTQNSSLSTGVDGGAIDLTALTQNNTRANLDLSSLSQNRQNVPLDLNSLSQNRQSVAVPMSSQADSISSAQQRPKPQRSKLPPPSKVDLNL